MKLLFLGDLHFGKKPSHSTRESALRHTFAVDYALASVIELAKQEKVDYIVQLGDVFDSYHASNTQFVRANHALHSVDCVLLGNHDKANNTYNVSALEDLSTICPAHFALTPKVRDLGEDVRLHLIPYMATQKLFLEAIANLDCQKGAINLLALHTNMYPENFEGTETENNLSEELALDLQDRGFKHIFSGHEHNASNKAGVHMVGGIYPFSFGDLTDKFAWIFDTETKAYTPLPTWRKQVGFNNVSAKEFLLLDARSDVLSYVEITGEVMPEQVLPVAKHMRHLFKHSPVLSIKNSLKVVRSTSSSTPDDKVLTDWKSYVSDALDSETRKELFQELIK